MHRNGEHQTPIDRQLRDQTLREVDHEHGLAACHPRLLTADGDYELLKAVTEQVTHRNLGSQRTGRRGVERTDESGGHPERAVRERNAARRAAAITCAVR